MARLVDSPPGGTGWVHEAKFDGYRLAAHLGASTVRLITRNGQDWTGRFEPVALALRELDSAGTVLDGEVVAVDSRGLPDFSALQQRAQPRAAQPAEGGSPLVFQIFDLLFLDGADLRREPLEVRKAALRTLLHDVSTEVLRFTGHLEADGGDVLAAACRMGLEGVVSKRAGSPYPNGRDGTWLKSACLQTDDLVVGGYTGPQGSRAGFGALLVGWPRTDGGLDYAGKVGTGFGRDGIAELLAAMTPHLAQRTPFADRLPPEARRTGVTFVEPRLVVEVAHSGHTTAGRLRHPRFRRLREDKAIEVRRGGDVASDPDAGSESVLGGVRLSSPDKVLYPSQGVTKRQLAEYYLAVGEHLLARGARRPLALVRCPQGADDQCFYQKHPGPSFAPGLAKVEIQEKDDLDDYVYLTTVGDLVSLAQLGVLELHGWGSTVADVERPDRLVFDLDPSDGVDFAFVKATARRLREVLGRLGLTGYLRATGGKGLHVVCPLVPEASWDEAKAFAKAVAEAMAAADPSRLTTELPKAKREGKVFIDYLRNGRGSTAILDYSPRARQGAPVAVPLRWDELGALKSPSQYDISSVRRRLGALKADPWEGHELSAVPLSKAVEAAAEGSGVLASPEGGEHER